MALIGFRAGYIMLTLDVLSTIDQCQNEQCFWEHIMKILQMVLKVIFAKSLS